MTTDIDLDAIRAREQAATPGPWGWRGHISQSVELRALHSGGLRIISTNRSQPCIGYTAAEELVLLDDACKACTAYLTGGGIGRGENPKCEKPENLDTVWTWHPDGFIRPINEWAKAEVLQWSKHMYRDDVKGTTHPDAEFIAAARTDVPRLLDIADAARYEFGAQPCIEGDCEHAAEVDENAPEGTPCPLVETRYATADDAIERDKLRADMDRIRPEMVNLRADLNFARADNAALRQQLTTTEADLAQARAEVDRLREQTFAQKPVIDAVEAWAELVETDSSAHDHASKLIDLHQAVEQYRGMDLALTNARTEQPTTEAVTQ